MEPPVSVKFCWTADDLYEAYCWNWRQSWRPAFRAAFNAAIYGVAVLSIVAGIVAYSQGNFSAEFMICPSLGLLWLLRLRMLRCLVRWWFAKRPDKNMEIEWEIAADKILVRNSIVRSELNWKAFVRVVTTPSGIMFYTLNRLLHYLPRRGFASDAAFEQVAALAKSNVQKFRRVE